MKPWKRLASPSPAVLWAMLALAALSVGPVFAPMLAAPFLLLCGAALLVAVGDLALLLALPKPAWAAPAVKQVTLSRYREKELALKCRVEPRGYGRVTRLAFRLPEGFARRSCYLKAPRAGEERLLRVAVLPMRRGDFEVRQVYLERASALGLWQSRSAVPMEWRLKVYPNLQADDRKATSFLLRKDLAGLLTRKALGKGREFDRLRTYQPGDAYADICWKASARRLQPITKVLQVERTQQVYAIVDTSRLSRQIVDTVETPEEVAGLADGALERQTWPVEAGDRFINGALSLGLATESQGDRLGIIGFSSFPHSVLKAGSGKTHYLAARDLLQGMQADADAPDYFELFSQIRLRVRQRSLLVIFSHFDDPSLVEGFLEAGKLVARQHVLVAATLLPGDFQPLFPLEADETADDLYRRLAGHERWQALQEVDHRMAPYGIRLLTARQEELCSRVVSRYMQIKERQLV